MFRTGTVAFGLTRRLDLETDSGFYVWWSDDSIASGSFLHRATRFDPTR